MQLKNVFKFKKGCQTFFGVKKESSQSDIHDDSAVTKMANIDRKRLTLDAEENIKKKIKDFFFTASKTTINEQSQVYITYKS